jgi:hypothetical protein
MGMNPEVMKTVMESNDIDTIKDAVKKVRKERRADKNLH